MTHLFSTAVDILCWVLLLPTVAWLGYRSYERSADRRPLAVKWIISAALVLITLSLMQSPGLLTSFLVLPFVVVLGLLWAPSLSSLLFKPLMGAFDGGDEEIEAKPFYFTAEGKRRKGLYEEAIAEVRKQLEKFPGDYEGYLKLASIQMENLKNLPAALATLNEFLALPERAPNQVVSVLHLLADWQLQFGRDAKAAEASLQRVVQLYPGTSFAHAAEQRLAHLVSADEASRARRESKFTVGPGDRDIGLRKESATAVAPSDPHTRAEEFVKQLELHPFDTEARERLAVLYAEEFRRLDLASDQLEQLIALPSEAPKHIAHWLNLLATLQIKHAQNLEAAQSALRRICDKFPGSAPATLALSRLATLQAELKGGQKTATKTIGSYEKNVGLKQIDG